MHAYDGMRVRYNDLHLSYFIFSSLPFDQEKKPSLSKDPEARPDFQRQKQKENLPGIETIETIGPSFLRARGHEYNGTLS